jgi:hypothetical protein
MCLTKFESTQILLNTISHQFLATTKLFTARNISARKYYADDHLVKVLPEVLGHEPEGTKIGLSKRIETRITVVGVGPEPLDAGGTQRALPRPRRISAHDVGACVRVDVPRALVVGPVGPVLVGKITPSYELLGVVEGEIKDAYLAASCPTLLQL